MQPEQRLSEHFFLSEFTASQEATRRGIRNEPLGHHIVNLARLAAVLERVRSALGDAPVIVTSGFRNLTLNAAVGSRPDSAHVEGRAADFIAPAFGDPRSVCQAIIDLGLPFDQLIWERTWVHFAIARAGTAPRSEVLSARVEPGSATRYTRGLA